MRDWLAKKRKQKNLTQAELAERVNITESYLCLIEQGERQKKLDITLAVKLADALNMEIAEVIDAENSEVPFSVAG
ncbi:MAG: helix-turn-helix transcriptional regulator [Lachnospiraceae bacterium]|nr:helix-turn-helix transcriptional regulator [Candidatus Hippenecus merdae]